MRNIVSPLDGIRSPFGRRLGAAPFSPAVLFAASEPGGWYDPSDLTTLFQDAAGTTPVTAVEQPVGLVLDKSRGLVLGNELVTNGDFSNGTTGWASSSTFTSTATVVDGTIQVSATAAYGLQLQAITCVVGRTYKVTGRARKGTINAAIFASASSTGASNVGISATITSTSFVDVTIHFVATATTMYICLGGIDASTSGTSFYDNISVRELPGSHLSQSTSTARPVLSARVNLLTRTEEFDNVAWTKDGGTITADGAISPIGTTTAERMTTNGTANTLKSVYQAHSLSAISYTVSVCVKDNGSTSRDFQIFVATNSLTVTVGTIYNFDTDTLTTQADATPFSGISASRTSLGSGWYRITLNFTVASAQTVRFYIAAPYVAAKAGDFYIWGADLRPANAGVGLPPYQRVGAATAGSSTAAGNADYDTTGFPLYLKFDGVDDNLASAAIDFSATDKMTVFAGVRKLSTAAFGGIVETSTDAGANNGAFAVFKGSNDAQYYYILRGSVFLDATSPASFSGPITNVLQVSADLAQTVSSSELTARINGAATTLTYSNGPTAGTGNFGNYPLNVGRRNNTPSYNFNGQLYSLIVRGAATDAATITATETWVNGKTKAF